MINTTLKENIMDSANLLFHISSISKFGVNDMKNAKIKFKVARSFTYLNNGNVSGGADAYVNIRLIFLSDKHALNFIKQARIDYIDIFITDSLDL
jgi:hypothetical protein